ncbi:MAG: hypothetical protein ABIA74_04980 [bacterium]
MYKFCLIKYFKKVIFLWGVLIIFSFVNVNAKEKRGIIKKFAPRKVDKTYENIKYSSALTDTQKSEKVHGKSSKQVYDEMVETFRTLNEKINQKKNDIEKKQGEEKKAAEEKLKRLQKQYDKLAPDVGKASEIIEHYEYNLLKSLIRPSVKKSTGVGTGVGAGGGLGLGGLGTASVGLAGLGTAGAAALEAGDVTEFTSWDEALLKKDEDKTEMPVGEVSGEEFKESEATKPEATKPETISEEPKKEKIVDQEKVVAEKIITPNDLLKLSEDQELSIQDANDLLNLVAAYVRQNILPKANKLILESATPIKIIDLKGDEISFVGKNFIKPYQEKMQEAEKAYQEAEKHSKELYDKKQSGEEFNSDEFELSVEQAQKANEDAFRSVHPELSRREGDRDDKEVILAFEKTQKAKEEIELAKSEMEKTLKSRSVFIPVDGQNTVYGFVQNSVDLIKQHTPKFDEIDLIKIFGFLPEGIAKKDILIPLPVAILQPVHPERSRREDDRGENLKKTEITAEQKSEKEGIVKPEVIVETEKVDIEKKVEEEKEPEPEKSKVVEWVKSKVKKIGEKGKELVGEELEDFKKKHLEEKPEDSTTTRIFKSVTKEVLTGTGKEDVEPVEFEPVAN